MPDLFNEESLREAIAGTWGEHGAHIDVFDMILKLARRPQPWVYVLQNEGLMVEVAEQAEGVMVLFIDFDNTKQDPEYADEVLAEITRARGTIPDAVLDRALADLLEQAEQS